MRKREILPLGVMARLGDDPLTALQKVRDMGFSTCQLANPPDEYIYGPQSEDMTQKVRESIKETGVHISAVFIMYKGHIWNLVDGPRTIGLVPEETRAVRVVHACRVSNWAKKIGVKTVTSHMGFIPVDPASPVYKGFIETMRAFVGFCGANGQTFAFETGQEPPDVLRRTIDDIGLENVGVNFDSANLILYGMGRPLEGIKAFGEFVVNTHCKDGIWPQVPGKLGREVPIGEGEVNFQEVIPALYEKGFRGPLTIEREIRGEEQIRDILRAKNLLEKIKDKILG